MLKSKWKKTILIAVPLVVLGSVAAFAAEGQSSNKLASATTTAPANNATSSAVSAQVVSSQTLTPEELQALETAKPAPATTTASTTTSTATGGFSTSGAADQSLIDANDPFSVQNQTGDSATASAGTSGASTGSTATNTPPATTGGTFSLDLVKNLEITTNTTQGVLKLHFTSDDHGKIKLEGDLGGRKIALEGAMAEQILNQVMQSMNLSDALTASLNGQAANLDTNVLQSLETLHVDLKDGRKIDTNKPGSAPAHGNAPKPQGRHDNGKHKGQEKGKGKHGED